MSELAPIVHEDTAQGPRASRFESDLPWIFAGRYEIQALLGAGGMGSVYAARDRELEDDVAIKMMRSELLTEPDVVERFRREVRLARRITHENVVRMYDLGAADGTRFLTMQRVVGRSLGDVIDQDGALGPSAIVRLARHVASGLAAAHRAGVIHRDLKPDNVVVDHAGSAVLTDFGIARPLSEAATEITLGGIGTPAYMAPELFGELDVADARCDVFSLGCLLFEAATGALPFAGTTYPEIIASRRDREAPDVRALRPDLPEGLALLVRRCLARDRRERHASAAEVHRHAEALEARDDVGSVRPRGLAARRRDHTPAALASPARSSVKTIAVLPFASAPDDAHLAGGVHEAILGALGRIPALRVRPRGRVAAHEASSLARSQVARDLDARVLVEGRLERDGQDVAVSVRAYGALESFPLWSGSFRCDIGAIDAFGATVARGIADALAVAPPEVAPVPDVDPRVAELVMRARHAYHGFWLPEAAQSLALFEAALALAPEHPAALSGRSLAALRVSLLTGEGLDDARRAAYRASEVAPDDAAVRVARAAISLQDGDVAAAVAEAKRAVLAAPELAEAHALLGRVLLEADLLPEGVQHLTWALALEPGLWIARWDLTRAHALRGDWGEVARLDATIDDRRVSRWLDRARYSLWRRDGAAAADYLAAMPSAATSGPIALARAVLELAADAPRSAEGVRALTEFRRQAGASRRQASFVAQIDAEIAAFQDRRADALQGIAIAASSGLTDLAWLMRCPLLDSLRQTPPFIIAVRHVGAIAARVREALYEE